MPARLTLSAARNVVWHPAIELTYQGAELPVAGARVDLQVRLYPGQPGPPQLDCPDVAFGDADLGNGNRALHLYPVATKAALAAMPTGLNKPEIGEADAYVFDILLTYADGLQDRLAAGDFLLEPGVTIYG
jgi:hypothetical protein